MPQRSPSAAEPLAPAPGEASELPREAADSADPLGLVAPVAWVGLVASLSGRAIAPSLHGSGQGLDRVIAYVDFGAGFATFFFAILALVAASLQLVHTAREPRLGLLYRALVIGFGTVIVSLVTPAMPLRLPDRGILITATSSAFVALIAARQGLSSPRTRALGFVLAGVGSSALLHLGALHLSASPLPRTLLFSRGLATASVALDGLSLFVAFAWLSTRAKSRISWPTTIALCLAMVAFWGAQKGTLEDASFWQIVAERSVARLSVGPASFVLPAVEQLFEIAALALAGAALFVRGQAAPVTASLSLLLMARPMTDVPIAATAVTLAALTTGLKSAAGSERRSSP